MEEKIENNNLIISPCPRASANFFSSVFFSWVYPFIRLGNQRELKVEDLCDILPGDDSEGLGAKLEREWKMELKKERCGVPSLTKALIRTFWLEFCKNGLLCMVEEWLFRIGQPLCLSQLVLYFDSDSQMAQWEAYLYATGVILGLGLYTFTHHPYFFTCSHLGMRVRVACCSLVYKKSLRLSQNAFDDTSVGQIVNIMSNDVSRFDLSVINLHYLLVGPVQVIIVTVVLYFFIGPSCLIGFTVIILFAPLQFAFGKIFTSHRMKTASRTDQRIRSMNEMISAMRVIKMYAWEDQFAKLIDMYRRMEVDVIRRTAHLRSFNASLYFILSKLVVFLTFVVYVLMGNTLAPNQVFMTAALFNNVRDVMTRFFSGAIPYAAEARTSINRVENFLLLDEIEKPVSKRPESLADCLIDCQSVTVKWPATAETEDNTLTDISFKVRPGQVLAVIGQVGSGKSSLLNVILGELSPFIGSCLIIKGKIAYASQEAWIFSGTIRQNITCGLEYNAQRYKKVVKVAALERDFHLFPQGDQTSVGERGISLSGGQKARINLARCLYVDADIYLMDDPLSAVDTHVGRKLFDQAINGFLRDKIRVLVTHQLQYLKDVDQILVLKKGRIEAIGSYKELFQRGLDLSKALKENDGFDENLFGMVNNDGKRPRSSSEISFRDRRSSSVISRASFNWGDYYLATQEELVEESHSSGSVSYAFYWQYLTSGGGIISVFLLILNGLIFQTLFSGSDYWLSIWTNAAQQINLTQNATITPSSSWKDILDNDTAIYVYSILFSGVFVFSLIRTFHFFILCANSSIHLHNEMFKAVIRAPLSFFDKNPVGRILNRFAKDIGCMDDQLPPTFFDVISIGLNATGTIVVIGVVNYWLIIPVILIAIVSNKLRIICLPAARAVKRLETTTKSPVFTHLASSMDGLTTLRAHNCEEIFNHSFNKIQDVHSSAWYMCLATSRWLGITVDWTCVAYVACVTYACTILRGSITSSAAGLAISSAMSLTGMLQWGTRQSTETGNLMTSVERVNEYSQLPSEAALESTPDKKPASDWPDKGSIDFDSMTLSYDKNQPALKNITCFIPSKSKIGIVGRTGAGKSSLITALFRLTEPDGRILIDGIDIKSIGLHDLRSKISIIPQDPVLFSGSLRKNLDPFGVFDDDVLWRALEDAKLNESIGNVETGLDWIIAEGGSNLSVGQRQLVCLSRAILRRNKILILDEATANVDQKTDSLIQKTIREKFTDCTVLTIAHRLNTIMDSDMVMVLDAGYLKEFDEPVVLLENSSSIFYSLVKQTGYLESTRLIQLAKQAAQKKT